METPTVLQGGSGSAQPPVSPHPEETTAPIDLLDWDQFIAVPPDRPHGTIQVRLIGGGKALPIPVPDPEDE
jgi:hypothetical protein